MEIFVVFKESMFFSEYNPIGHCQSYTVHSFQFPKYLYSFLIHFFNLFIPICRNSYVLPQNAFEKSFLPSARFSGRANQDDEISDFILSFWQSPTGFRTHFMQAFQNLAGK